MRIFTTQAVPVVIALFLLLAVSLSVTFNFTSFQILVGGEQNRENTLQSATIDYGAVAGFIIVLAAIVVMVAYFRHESRKTGRVKRGRRKR